MTSFRALFNTIQAVRELRPGRVAALALYRFGLRSGHYRRVLNAGLAQRLASGVGLPVYRPIWRLPSPADLRAVLSAADEKKLLAQADEVVGGWVGLFGAQRYPLQLIPPQPLADWSAYESGRPAAGASGRPELDLSTDIKLLWEPARFGWVFTLGRAYRLSGDERYAQVFWEQAEAFLDANPPYLGPHWASAQEVALRLLAFTFALHVFQASPHTLPERSLRLLRAIAVHAGRIPPTLVYARAQDNNHLLSEAAGLAAAAALLPTHPQAGAWRKLGWSEFKRGLRSQIAPDGAYSQHSANYHRLMLQLATWMASLSEPDGPGLDADDRRRLAAATEWLLALLDPMSGCAPNLGPNDGAYIFPFSALAFEDYRPVLQCAGSVFLGRAVFPPGAWDEMRLWFTSSARGPAGTEALRLPGSTPHVLRSADGRSWAYLRAVRFNSRPGHADQLHLDLWHDGVNIAQDAGAYSYNAPPPWDNALASSLVHNTVTVDALDQMRRAGRFLYVDWAQAEILPLPADQPVAALTVRHNGYRRLGLMHQRRVQVDQNGAWEIEDTVSAPGVDGGRVETSIAPANAPHRIALHWLLPDGRWQVDAHSERGSWGVTLTSPASRFRLDIQAHPAPGAALSHDAAGGAAGVFQIMRAGECVYGAGDTPPILGWASPTYGLKVPALSVRCIVLAPAARFTSRFTFDSHQQ